jgi:hypothetical protein
MCLEYMNMLLHFVMTMATGFHSWTGSLNRATLFIVTDITDSFVLIFMLNNSKQTLLDFIVAVLRTPRVKVNFPCPRRKDTGEGGIEV